MTGPARFAIAAWAATLLCWGGQDPGLEQIGRIADLERRSRQALAFALEQFDAAVAAYRSGDVEKGKQALGTMGAAVKMAVEALQATGKHPRRHPRHFKHAEIRTRKLLRQLSEERARALLEDRDDFDDAIRDVEKANVDLLLGIMSRRD